MSDTLRAIALLLSVALWSPVARPLLAGDTSPEQAAVLYAVALVIALAGCALMSALVRTYAPAGADDDQGGGPAQHEADGNEHARRQEDALS